MALLLARAAGPQALVLVDTGHHYQAQNIEQIVAWLLHQNMMGGFHFNDRRYADDDLTLGSIDPYQIFRIFHEIRMFEWETQTTADIAYMVDQSHNLKGKIEAMIQTVCTAQELYARAALVDHGSLGVEFLSGADRLNHCFDFSLEIVTLVDHVGDVGRSLRLPFKHPNLVKNPENLIRVDVTKS